MPGRNYGYVANENESCKALTDIGAEVVMQPKDVAEGLLVAQVELDGNVLDLRMHPKK
jgi:hypothetical protein